MERTESEARARQPWAGRRPGNGTEAPRSSAGREPPPSSAGREPPPPPPGGIDLSLLFVALDALRRAVPGELQSQFNALVREVLITLRGLIDWYLDRLERPDREPRVEDIPVE